MPAPLPRLVTGIDLDVQKYMQNLAAAEQAAKRSSKKIQDELSGIELGLKKIEQAIKKQKNSWETITSSMGNFLKMAASAVAIGWFMRLADAIMSIPGAIIRAETEMYKLERSFTTVYKSVEKGNKELAIQKKLFQEYGVEFNKINQGSLRLAVAGQAAGFSDTAIKEMQEAILKMAKGLALPENELGSVYKVFMQMLSKQQIYAEEVIQQLAEFTPSGVTTLSTVLDRMGLLSGHLKTSTERAKALRDMMKEGAVPIETVHLLLKELARDLGVTADKTKDTESEWNRMMNSLGELNEQLAKSTSLGETWREILRTIATVADTAKTSIKGLSAAYNAIPRIPESWNPSTYTNNAWRVLLGSYNTRTKDETPLWSRESFEKGSNKTQTIKQMDAFLQYMKGTKSLLDKKEVEEYRRTLSLIDDKQLREDLEKWDKYVGDVVRGYIKLKDTLKGVANPEEQFNYIEGFYKGRGQEGKKLLDKLADSYQKVERRARELTETTNELTRAQKLYNEKIAAAKMREASEPGTLARVTLEAGAELAEVKSREEARQATAEEQKKFIQEFKPLSPEQVKVLGKLIGIKGKEGGEVEETLRAYQQQISIGQGDMALFQMRPEEAAYRLNEAFNAFKRAEELRKKLEDYLKPNENMELGGIGGVERRIQMRHNQDIENILREGAVRGVNVDEDVRLRAIQTEKELQDLRYKDAMELEKKYAAEDLPELRLPTREEVTPLIELADMLRSAGLRNAAQAVMPGSKLIEDYRKAQMLFKQLPESDDAKNEFLRNYEQVKAAIENLKEKSQDTYGTLDELQERFTKNGAAARDAAENIQHLVALLVAKRKTREEFDEQIKETWSKYWEETDVQYREGIELMRSGAEEVQGIIQDTILGFAENGFEGLEQNFVKMLDNMAAQIIAHELGRRLFGSLLDSGTSPTMKNTGWIGSAIGWIMGTPKAHGGGTYEDIRRLHSGYNYPNLDRSEFPAILQKDETVFTKGQMKQLGQRSVNVVMNIQQPIGEQGLRANSRQLAASIQRELVMAQRREGR